jgi:hypothetical protein
LAGASICTLRGGRIEIGRVEGSAPEQQDGLAEQRRAELRDGERPSEHVDEIHKSPNGHYPLGALARARARPDGSERRPMAMGLGLKGGEPHERPGRHSRGDDGSMPKQQEQIQAPSAKAGKPVLQGQLADPELLGDDRAALSVLQPRHRFHHDLDARHLAGKRVTRQDSLPALAAQTHSQPDGADLEGRERVKLAGHAAARQARTRRRAAVTAAGEQLLVDHFGICEERLVVSRMHVEYVRHVLAGGPGCLAKTLSGAVLLLLHTISTPGRDVQGPKRGAPPRSSRADGRSPLSSGCDSQGARGTTRVKHDVQLSIVPRFHGQRRSALGIGWRRPLLNERAATAWGWSPLPAPCAPGFLP